VEGTEKMNIEPSRGGQASNVQHRILNGKRIITTRRRLKRKGLPSSPRLRRDKMERQVCVGWKKERFRNEESKGRGASAYH